MIFKLYFSSLGWYRMVQDINTALSHCGIATHARRHRERGASRGGKEFFAVVHIVELLPLEHELKLLVAFLDLKFHRKLIRNDLDEVAHPERVVVVVMVLVVHQELGPRLDPEDVRELVQGAVRGDLPDVDVPIGADEGVDRVVLQVRGRRGLVSSTWTTGGSRALSRGCMPTSEEVQVE